MMTFEEMMHAPKVSFIKVHQDAMLPERKHKEFLTGDSGYDIYSVEDMSIPAHSTTKVKCGLEIAYIQPGYWIRVESRSGLFFKNGISSFNGIIDCSYRGELGIVLINNSDKEYQVLKGDRISQIVLYKLLEPAITWAEKKEETVRGTSGFGSTGR